MTDADLILGRINAERFLNGAMRLDRAWKIVRRASGHEQKSGMLERIFVISMVIGGTAFLIWLLVIQGPGPELTTRQG